MDAWEPQKGESAKAYEAFVTYRDMGPTRSISKAAALCAASEEPATKTKQRRDRFGIWSGCWRWVERSLAWDAELDRQRRTAFAAEARKLAEQQARVAMAIVSKGSQRMKAMDEAELDPRAALAYIQTGFALARQAYGLDSPGEAKKKPDADESSQVVTHEQRLACLDEIPVPDGTTGAPGFPDAGTTGPGGQGDPGDQAAAVAAPAGAADDGVQLPGG